MVQGGFVGESQRYANTMGANVRGINSVESRVLTQNRGNIEISQLRGALNLSEDIMKMAQRMYGLALNHNFVQGRRVRNVAAVALYLAARKQPENTLMLMDLSERVMCNVWALGDTYKQFCKTIMESDPFELAGNRTVQEIEPLMLKFCRKLEFGTDSHKVANDACGILRRMKRDWMVQGRNPAGLCGACIILAARMNNFRRTVREVVYVVKVADTTINARLHEYKRTPSSALTVEQFRKFGQQLKVRNLPPAIYKRAEKEQREEYRKRKAEELEVDAEAEHGQTDDQADGSSSEASSTNKKMRPARTMKKRKLDKGKTKAVPSQAGKNGPAGEPAVPDIEALAGDSEAALDALAQANGAVDVEFNDEEVVVPKKRGRRPKKVEPIIIPDEELEIEAEIEQEITQTVTNWQATFKEFQNDDNHEVLVRAGDRARELVQLHMPDANINDDDLHAGEFDDDPDVANAIIHDEAEIRFRERNWITDNEDWLRKQQQKMLAKALEEAKGEQPKIKHRRKVNRMGDGAVLEGETGMSAAAAAQKMIKKRAKHFSNAIDYEKLKELFPETQTQTPQASSIGASPAASAGQQDVVPTPPATHVEVPVGDDDAEGEEEEEQQTYQEEDEDLEYYSDEDEGIRPEDLAEDY